jgi:hypothetical protein
VDVANAVSCAMLEGASPFEPEVRRKPYDAGRAAGFIRNVSCRPESLLTTDLDCTFEARYPRDDRAAPSWRRYVANYRRAPESLQGYWGDWCTTASPFDTAYLN